MKMMTITRSAERIAARILIRVKSSPIFCLSASIRPARPPASDAGSLEASFCLMASTSTTLVAGYLMNTSTTLLSSVSWPLASLLPSSPLSIRSMLRVPRVPGWPEKAWMSWICATPPVMVDSRSEMES